MQRVKIENGFWKDCVLCLRGIRWASEAAPQRGKSEARPSPGQLSGGQPMPNLTTDASEETERVLSQCSA
ncbi:hypothetical protein TNCT_167071 [Trichonephila clavata]|uniref:Uncharacterized protein n=1 Tax=Trichonephila clavata TaxID=2740835 RepID=A0A8X6LJR5_TRICU|nr:hypothetical protein TNCT_167071 [Trichonephila clavata]